MPIFETLSLTLGAAIAKHIIKSWLGDKVGDIGGELLDLLKGKAESTLAQREAARRIEKIGQEVAIKLRPLFEVESSKANVPDIKLLTQEVALTLAKTSIDAKQVLDYRFDAERLASQLIKSRPEVVKNFSEAEASLYERFLREVCNEIVAIANELGSFDRHFSETTLQNQDQVLALVEKIFARPSEEAAAFERLYCQTIIRQLDRMELFGVKRMDDATKHQSLSVAYVAIDVDQSGNKDCAQMYESARDESMPEAKGMRLAPQSGPIDQLLRTTRKIIVRGQAGLGKSTLLQWLAVRSASHDFPAHLSHWNKTIPFFIRLREHVNKDFPNPEEFPGLIAPTVAGGMPHGWVHEQLSNGRAVVLIDGVDELPSTQRPAMLEHLQQLVSNYPHARYLITSRPAALKAELWPEWHEWIKQESFVETSLQPMSQSHIENFIDQWHEAFAKTITEEDELAALKPLPENLKRQLRQRPPLRRLADNPLLCAMICALHRERHENLPAERIELYKGCVDMLLSRRDTGRKIDIKTDYPDLSDPQKLVFAQSFAYWLMKNGYSDVEQSEADSHFEGKCAEMNLSDNVTGEGVRRLLMDRANLLREPIALRVDFTHRTFQEYLAAQAAIKESDVGVLIDHSHDDQWRETIILATGEARPKEREKILEGLLAKADKQEMEPHRKKLCLLAVACLEMCVELAPKVRHLVMDKAAPLFPPRDEDDVKLIAAAGAPAVTLLAYSSDRSGTEAARCVKALAMIGSNRAMSAISEYARESDKHWRIRNEIGLAWGQFERSKFAKEVLIQCKELSLENFSSWEGFEYLLQLEWLMISESHSTNLSPIQALTKLNHLNLNSWNQLHDLSGLIHAPSLRSLIIQNCRCISDLSPLVHFKCIEDLLLSNCPHIRDISYLAQITNLTRLTISKLSEVNLDAIAAMRSLTSLEIRNVRLDNSRIFHGLTKLKRVFLEHTQLRNLDFISELSELTQVGIVNEEINDLSVLSSLPRLSSVFVHHTKITDLRPLQNLTELTSLNINNTSVSDLSPLANLTNLERLDVTGTPVKDLSPVKGIKELKIIR